MGREQGMNSVCLVITGNNAPNPGATPTPITIGSEVAPNF